MENKHQKIRFLSVFLILFLFSFGLQAQGFQVDFFPLEDEITVDTDLSNDGSYRWKSYEMYLREGDLLYIYVFSNDILPYLSIESPDKSEKPIFIEPDESTLRIERYFAVKHSGTHRFFVICSPDNVGKFTFNIWFENNAAQNLRADADLCETISFLLEHQKADYFFLKGDEIEYGRWKPKTYFMDFDSCFIVSKYHEFYEVNLYKGNDIEKAKQVFLDYSTGVKDCFSEDWTYDSKKGRYKFYGLIYDRERITWTSKKGKEPLYYYIEFVDNTLSNYKEGIYRVNIEFHKKRE